MSNRWAWVWPAVAGAVLTALVIGVLRIVLAEETTADALPRTPARSTASESTTEPTSSAPPSWTPEEARSRLHLQGTGLDMVGFGASQRDVVRTLTDMLGPPDEETDLPCDGHPQVQTHWVRWADLSVVFDAGTFVGYMEGVHFPPGSPAVDLGTDRGLSPGDSFESAQQVYGELQLQHQAPLPGPGSSNIFRFEDPSSQRPMFGVVEDPDQTVITIYAGDLC